MVDLSCLRWTLLLDETGPRGLGLSGSRREPFLLSGPLGPTALYYDLIEQGEKIWDLLELTRAN